MAGQRTVWHEVIERRHQLHARTGIESMETWAPADLDWVTRLGDAFEEVRVSREEAASRIDPREALIDLLAVGSAWVDAFDQRGPIA